MTQVSHTHPQHYFELLKIVNKKKIKYCLVREGTNIKLDPLLEIKIIL
jgi:hypothetical protein